MSRPGLGRSGLLRRVALLREVEHQAAARAAAAAETARVDVAALVERTLRMAQDYATEGGASDGAALAGRARFAGTLRAIHATADADHARARVAADERLAALAEADRRRDAVRERIAAESRRTHALPEIGRRLPPRYGEGDHPQDGEGAPPMERYVAARYVAASSDYWEDAPPPPSLVPLPVSGRKCEPCSERAS